jgi:hypothetical protein
MLAGGAIRDEFLGLTPKDYDIFVPLKHKSELYSLALSVSENPIHKSKAGDYDTIQKIINVYGLEVAGKKIDLIGINEKDDEDFPDIVIGAFNFGINMAYDTGSYQRSDHPYFRGDLDERRMSLRNLEDMSHLPKMVAKFNNLNERLGEGLHLAFRAPCLTINVQNAPVEPTFEDIFAGAVARPAQPTTRPWAPTGHVPMPVRRTASAGAFGSANPWDAPPVPTTAGGGLGHPHNVNDPVHQHMFNGDNVTMQEMANLQAMVVLREQATERAENARNRWNVNNTPINNI